MPTLRTLGVVGTGGLGVLVAGLLLSKLLNTDQEGTIGAALIIFVIAGAVALIARYVR